MRTYLALLLLALPACLAEPLDGGAFEVSESDTNLSNISPDADLPDFGQPDPPDTDLPDTQPDMDRLDPDMDMGQPDTSTDMDMGQPDTNPPDRCGDGIVTAPEVCDNGPDCTTNCQCATGFEPTNNGTCVDQNECAFTPCDAKADCSNTEGSFSCTCRAGYVGTGFTCTMEIPDVDGDTIPDVSDNCPLIANPNQVDFDLDGVGDACDNCRYVPNSFQINDDSDSFGNVCDNCPLVTNPSQVDTGNVGVGDACLLNPPTALAVCSEKAFLMPKVYFLSDLSAGMGTTSNPNSPISIVHGLFSTVVSSIYDKVEFGIGFFQEFQPGCSNNLMHSLPVRVNPSTVQNAWLNAPAPAGVRIGGVIEDAFVGGVLGTRDPDYQYKKKLLILITSGNITSTCGGTEPGIDHFIESGVDVRIIGIDSFTQTLSLNPMTSNYPVPTEVPQNLQSLRSAVLDPIHQMVDCTDTLLSTPSNPDHVYVSQGGVSLTRDNVNGFSYDATTNSVTLQGAACANRSNATLITVGTSDTCP